jgi:hypothetical protein
MLFVAVLIAVFVSQCLRGCAKYIVVALILAAISWKDPVMFSKLNELANSAWHALREWIVNQ